MRLSGNEDSRQALGISWMTGAELTKAVPPAFTRYIAESGGIRQCTICGPLVESSARSRQDMLCGCRKALSRDAKVPRALFGTGDRKDSGNDRKRGACRPMTRTLPALCHALTAPGARKCRTSP